MRIEKIQSTNSEQALDILKETAEWLKKMGSSQWADVLEGTDKHGLAEAVKRGNVYFYYDNKELVGMFAAWKEPSSWDQLLWGAESTFSNAYYIHRVIIRPKYKGKNYGDQLLTDIKSQFKCEVEELRLDCLASNQKLVSFYSRNKFNKVKTSKDSNGELFELFSYELK